jgi:cobalt-zinc-cadmium efflux system membrane fusion protein
VKLLSLKVSLIFIGLVIYTSSCTNNQSAVNKITEEEVLPEDIVELRSDQIKMANIEFGKVEIHQLGNTLKVNGIVTVSPQNMATVCMPLGGFIKNTTLLPGNAVTKGETIAIIENQDFVDIQQYYLEAKNKLFVAEAEYNRHTDLFKDEVYSQQNLQEVTMEYRNLKARVKSLEEKLILIGINPTNLSEDNISSSVNLISPINGYLKEVNVNIGKYVSPTDVLFEIVNSDKLLLELTLFEKDADKVISGQKLKFYINNETEDHEAVITQTGKSISMDKTLRVYASVKKSCKNLIPGMYVSAFIEVSDNNVTALPSEAVVSFDDKAYIFIYEKEKEEAGNAFTEYRMIEITTGVSGSGYTEVRLPEGFNLNTERVVIKGTYNLLSAKKNAGEMAC